MEKRARPAATDEKPTAAAERTADEARALSDLDRRWPASTRAWPYASRNDAAPFSVVCTKSTGVETTFGRYQSRSEAERIAQHLRVIGCTARVVVPEGQA